MYNLQQIQAGQLCFHYSMSVSGQLLFLIFSALGALAQKRNQVMSNQSNLKGLQICKCENDVESSHDVDVLCRSFAGRKHHCFPWALTHIDVDVGLNPRNCSKKGYFERSCCKPFVRRAALTWAEWHGLHSSSIMQHCFTQIVEYCRCFFGEKERGNL